MRKIMSSVFQLTYIYDKSNAVCFHIIFQPYLLYVLFFDMPPSVTRILTTMYAPVKKEIYSPSRGEDDSSVQCIQYSICHICMYF